MNANIQGDFQICISVFRFRLDLQRENTVSNIAFRQANIGFILTF